jgi:hypothetical protein
MVQQVLKYITWQRWVLLVLHKNTHLGAVGPKNITWQRWVPQVLKTSFGNAGCCLF